MGQGDKLRYKDMNNIISNFAQIIDFARQYNLPLTRKQAILREYLQSKILELIYQEKISKHIYFIGGTALRLLHDLDRFSEDLDFDVDNINPVKIKALVKKVHQELATENLTVELYENTTQKRNYYELRFKNLLFELNISRSKSEKLMIKLDFEYFWRGMIDEIVLFQRYGFLSNIISLPLHQILVQKLSAYLNRQQTLPRDIYDITWLIAHGAKIDTLFLQKNKLPGNIVSLAINKYTREEKKLDSFKRQLKPFLINEPNIEKLTFFPKLLKSST